MITLNDLEWGTVGEWVGAFATFSAVIVSLYLARSSGTPKIKVNVRVSYIVTQMGLEREPSFYTVEAINIGTVPVKLIECSVELPNNNRIAFISSNKIDNLPIQLTPSENIECQLPYSDVNEILRKQNLDGKKISFFFKNTSGKVYRKSLKIIQFEKYSKMSAFLML
jgi:hypothetical protein